MISSEDIKRLRNQKNASQKDATHKDTPHTHDKKHIYSNTHATRQGGRTDHSTSSHGPDPSSTDRVMKILRDVSIIVWGYSGIVLGRLTKEIKSIRDTLWK